MAREAHLGDRVFARTMLAAGLAVVLLLAAIGIFLARESVPAFERFGPGFLIGQAWDPVKDEYGALPVIFGTAASSLLALLIATPLSVGVALFLTELAPRRLAAVLAFLVQMLAAIPSVVYGLWGIFVLAPLLREHAQPALGEWLGPVPILGALFAGPPFGIGMLCAALVLAIMILPTITSLSVEVFRAIPALQREAALGLGATRWEMMRLAVLASSRAGVLGAVILGLGRAIGETMAVTMVIGNRPEISASLFAPAQTMASAIANQYAEASGDLHLASLTAVGLALFGISFLMNLAARLLLRGRPT